MNKEQAAELRKEFDPAQIGKLPRAGIKLDYVGHAAVTDRLLKVDPEWTWEPLAYAENGSPLIETTDKGGKALWIKLTVAGVTRLGVGTVDKDKAEAEKQLIGDALRNAAMRFGVALDLWSKEDLDQGSEAAREPEPTPDQLARAKGWTSDSEWRKQAQTIQDRIKTAPISTREAMKRYRDTEDIQWPPTSREAFLLTQKLEELELLAEGYAEAPESLLEVTEEPEKGVTPQEPQNEAQAVKKLEAELGAEDVTPATKDQIDTINTYLTGFDTKDLKAPRRAVTKYLREKSWPTDFTELTLDQANTVLDFIESM